MGHSFITSVILLEAFVAFCLVVFVIVSFFMVPLLLIMFLKCSFYILLIKNLIICLFIVR